jgi:SAM-dependent MidA family methyltransferase
MAEIEKKLAPTQGSALIIDYGDFTPPPRLGDTLQAIHKHKKVHPLTHVGLADLTHHVDFYTLQSLVSKTVRRTLINQGQFLKNIGFLERTQYLCNKADPFTAKDLTLAAARLTSSAEMGALFKVLILEFVN